MEGAGGEPRVPSKTTVKNLYRPSLSLVLGPQGEVPTSESTGDYLRHKTSRSVPS